MSLLLLLLISPNNFLGDPLRAEKSRGWVMVSHYFDCTIFFHTASKLISLDLVFTWQEKSRVSLRLYFLFSSLLFWDYFLGGFLRNEKSFYDNNFYYTIFFFTSPNSILLMYLVHTWPLRSKSKVEGS